MKQLITPPGPIGIQPWDVIHTQLLPAAKRQAVNFMNTNGETLPKRRHGKFLNYNWLDLGREPHGALMMAPVMMGWLYSTLMIFRGEWLISRKAIINQGCVSLTFMELRRSWGCSHLLLIPFILHNKEMQGQTDWSRDADLMHKHTSGFTHAAHLGPCSCGGKWFSAWATVEAMAGVNGKICVWFWHRQVQRALSQGWWGRKKLQRKLKMWVCFLVLVWSIVVLFSAGNDLLHSSVQHTRFI